ncbi:MAG: DEAD/DEAH box helicase [Gammaproteobacteria bacterium]|jgi:ATP-dependent RNA helicase DeaD|nr:DEAD/DEAH box helicase [Gammaproteobacteria bacterium]MBT3860811.1 DEAD/DEAH box helicase [Gammaproteobacteria bacterium]MBT3986934.1 DEAD/DEAH box helicase [Gammaproteobacteria bacterium]MBT4255062.1 DEAD/DEAH box helicase [Gammaproteobacteria bacterium]MBT4582085.1 DEAD/DEAH box helicase [Gammaproteobacteria bacterium]
MTSEAVVPFSELELSVPILKALNDVGYETPSPIQAETIPLLLEGRDVLGQAQTGTGKTAAFALPVLSAIDIKQKDPQVLVLAPTRELAIQVAEAFQKYANHIKGFHVLPVYGGQDYSGQIRALKRGVHVVVGTPGRVMDHMRKRTLKLDNLKTLVLDEADEMLRMGFIDDVEWILEQTPDTRQIALFSATMPQQVRRIATAHLNNPAQVTIKATKASAKLIRQRFWPVSGMHKLDALTRILEAENFDGMIIFVRTRIATVELADKLSARGFAATALNGDIAQKQRERTVDQLKKGKLDILVATDVAARGLDVDRVSHVVNYDIPHDTEAYIHRIGRTGRAGREGDAILFVAPRERRMLNAIERATQKKIELMELPSTELINDKRVETFKQAISDTLATEDLGLFTHLIEQYQQEHNVPALEIASALARLVQGDTPLLLQHKPIPKHDHFAKKESRREERKPRRSREGGEGKERGDRAARPPRKVGPPDKGMERFRIQVGHNHKVMPGNIVGAIANEAGIDSENIGRITIFDNHSLIDLPENMPHEIFKDLKKVWVSGQTLNISRDLEKDQADKPFKRKDRGPLSKPDASKKKKDKPRSKTKGKIKTKSKARSKPGDKKAASSSSKKTGASKGPKKSAKS